MFFLQLFWWFSTTDSWWLRNPPAWNTGGD